MEQKRGTKGLKSQGYLLFHSFVAPLTLYVLFSYCGQTECTLYLYEIASISKNV